MAAGDRVEVAVGRDVIRPDESWKGRVISASATPLDGKGHLPEGNQPRPLRAALRCTINRPPTHPRAQQAVLYSGPDAPVKKGPVKTESPIVREQSSAVPAQCD